MRRGNGFVRLFLGMFLAFVLVLGVCGGVGAEEKPATAREVQELRNEIFKLQVEIKNSDATQKLQIQNSNDRLSKVKDWVENREMVSTYWYYALMFCSGVVGLYMAGIAIWFTLSNKQNRAELKAETEDAKAEFQQEIEKTIQECESTALECKVSLESIKGYQTTAQNIIDNLSRQNELNNHDKMIIKAEANRESNTTPAQLSAKAVVHEFNKEWDKAIKIWELLQQEYPNSFIYKYRTATAYGMKSKENTNVKEKMKSSKQAENILRSCIQKWPNESIAFDALGNTLSNRSSMLSVENKKALVDEAITYHNKALAINDKSYNFWNNLACSLVNKATIDRNNVDIQVLNEAILACNNSESLQIGSGSYNLACIYSLREELPKSKEALIKAKLSPNKLPPYKHMKNEPDLANIRNHPNYKKWFNIFLEQALLEEQAVNQA